MKDDPVVAMRLAQPLMEPSPAGINLRRLVVYRYVVLAGLIVGVAVAVYRELVLPLWPLSVVIGVFAALNLVTWLRLRWMKRPVREQELFLHLFGDVLILAALLYFTGGSTNPFVSLFLLPLTLAAAALPGRYTGAIAATALACYSLLMKWYFPLPHQYGGNFNVHVVGMWFGFVLSAILISYFAVKMSATLRERDRALARAREDALRDERLVALGTLAAGAAHELGTPLATMAVLAKDLESECAAMPELAEPFQVLRSQIARCKDTLAQLAVSAGQTRAEAGRDQALDHYLAQLVEQWRNGRSAVTVHRTWEGTRPAPHILADQTLTQAITNILNNAADASERDVEVIGRWDNRELRLEICDRGEGLSAAAQSHAGEPFFTTKPPGQGLGLGLFLAQSTIRRLGGEVELVNRQQGGVCTRIVLPLPGLIMTV
ncbi:MAG: ATP-binding protein [Gammaproteobacteria bacterium]